MHSVDVLSAAESANVGIRSVCYPSAPQHVSYIHTNQRPEKCLRTDYYPNASKLIFIWIYSFNSNFAPIYLVTRFFFSSPSSFLINSNMFFSLVYVRMLAPHLIYKSHRNFHFNSWKYALSICWFRHGMNMTRRLKFIRHRHEEECDRTNKTSWIKCRVSEFCSLPQPQ